MKPPVSMRIIDGHIYKWHEPDSVEIEIVDITYKAGDWNSYVTCRTRAPGLSPHLKEGKLNLAAPTSRSQWAKMLTGLYDTQIPWDRYLEMACVLTIRAEREGEPFLTVGSLPADQQPPLWLVEKMLRMHAPNSIFGDGGVGKSTLAALIAACVAGGIEIAGFRPNFVGGVLWLDWESDEWDIDDTIKQLKAGHEMDWPDFCYRRETWPLTQTFKQMARTVVEKEIALVVVDSVGYAMGSDPENAHDTLKFTQAVRALNSTVLLIDHVVKGESRGKAFGSAYKHNEVRTGFEILRQQVPGESVSHLGVYQQKANKGGFIPPFGLKVEFGDGWIRYEREQIREESLVAELPVSKRIERVLGQASGLMNADEIHQGVNAFGKPVPLEQVKARLSDMRGQLFVTEARGAARRYALKSDRVEVGPR